MEPIDACATADPHASLATSVGPWPLSPMPNPAWQADNPPINSTTIINLLMISTLRMSPCNVCLVLVLQRT
jgi:hypothetical protein